MTNKKDKFKERYRIPSARLETWDYGSNGDYFVTICIHQHICCLGSISKECCHLNKWGQIVSDCWMAIPEHFPFVRLGVFVVMPNHIHGIISIEKKTGKTTLSSIVGSFKSACTKNIRREFPESVFRWQERFHDHIIRTEEAYKNISWYILNNPIRWQKDSFYR